MCYIRLTHRCNIRGNSTEIIPVLCISFTMQINIVCCSEVTAIPQVGCEYRTSSLLLKTGSRINLKKKEKKERSTFPVHRMHTGTWSKISCCSRTDSGIIRIISVGYCGCVLYTVPSDVMMLDGSCTSRWLNREIYDKKLPRSVAWSGGGGAVKWLDNVRKRYAF